ncbi:60S ribosomal protein L35-B [Mizuhopecten yessoensis]|uniref:Large ribosomal subunit protein uL29 n=1 Tax=Mizuhopecten yessoensis TaxID=6573 RepID=A0A210PKM5_MIZYE|nr:60S ribosomal protein L35-B [Mizuhopecten yessoensis]
MTEIKAYELRTKTKAELVSKLAELKAELASLRVQKVNGNNAKLSKIQEVRKGIAVINTVISQSQREQQKTLFKGKKYLPLDLRYKKTRAIRRRLTPFEASQKTVRQTKHDTHFAQRKYAVKA